jgi:hypothetical protein
MTSSGSDPVENAGKPRRSEKTCALALEDSLVTLNGRHARALRRQADRQQIGDAQGPRMDGAAACSAE